MSTQSISDYKHHHSASSESGAGSGIALTFVLPSLSSSEWVARAGGGGGTPNCSHLPLAVSFLFAVVFSSMCFIGKNFLECCTSGLMILLY